MPSTQPKLGSLRDWIDQTFGAVEVAETICEVGHTVHGVWRPGLFYSEEVLQGLSAKPSDLRLAEQALLLLIQRRGEWLHFIEPSPVTLQAYSHKARELLILSITEVENAWKATCVSLTCHLQEAISRPRIMSSYWYRFICLTIRYHCPDTLTYNPSDRFMAGPQPSRQSRCLQRVQQNET